MNDDIFDRLTAGTTLGDIAARTHEHAIAEAFARGAGGVDGNGTHKAQDAADDLMAVLHGVETSTPFGGAR